MCYRSEKQLSSKLFILNTSLLFYLWISLHPVALLSFFSLLLTYFPSFPRLPALHSPSQAVLAWLRKRNNFNLCSRSRKEEKEIKMLLFLVLFQITHPRTVVCKTWFFTRVNFFTYIQFRPQAMPSTDLLRDFLWNGETW